MHRDKDRWHRSNNNTITTHKKETNQEKINKRAKSYDRNKLYNKKRCICIALIQGNKKILIKFASMSAKLLKTVKCLPKILFKIDIIDLCLLSCCCIFFKRWLKSVTKVFMSNVVPENFSSNTKVLFFL